MLTLNALYPILCREKLTDKSSTDINNSADIV